jgi:hypothetical protein
MNTDNSSFDKSDDKTDATYDSGNMSEDTKDTKDSTVKGINTIQKLTQEAELESVKRKPFYKLNLLEMVIELKNTWFSILDELLAGNYSMSILIKNNRLFYVGLTILIISIILYIYDYAIDSDPLQKLLNGGSGGVVEIRHIYEPHK